MKPENPLDNLQVNMDNQGKSRDILTTVFLIAAALGVAILLTAFVFQQYEVDGPSMQTTLQNHDRLVVVKLPKTWSLITGHLYIPTRGTVIVFNQSGLFNNATGAQEKQLIKRVIGLPGDHVVIKDGSVTIFNKDSPKGFDPDKTMPYGKVITYTSSNVDVVIQTGHVFVMGDNRPDSLDSRYFGQIDAKNIVGKLDLRIYPVSTVRVF